MSFLNPLDHMTGNLPTLLTGILKSYLSLNSIHTCAQACMHTHTLTHHRDGMWSVLEAVLGERSGANVKTFCNLPVLLPKTWQNS